MKIKEKYANVEQVRRYTKKNGNFGFKYMIHQEKWNTEKKKYEGWECVTVWSDIQHNAGDFITYKYEYNQNMNIGRYVEIPENEVEEDNS